VVIGAFMATITGVKRGELRLIEEGGVRGGVAAPWHGRRRAASMARRRRCRLGEGGRGRGGTAWWAGSACLAARGQKGRMGRLATGLIGPKVEENSFSNKN
jgi:hypothetical protein